MKSAFVFSGGGSLGAVQVGMLQALTEAGIEPDLVVGASVGAINAAWVAEHPGAAGVKRLDALWRGIRRNEIFPPRPLTGFLGFIGQRPSFMAADGLQRLIEHNIVSRRLEDTRLPLSVVAADLGTGKELVLDHGDLVPALLASAAIPGVFPPVKIGGHVLVDGGVLDNTPISAAVKAGAERIWVLPTGYACALHDAPASALAVVMQSVTIMVHQRLDADVHAYQGSVDLRVAPPLCPLTVSPMDFTHTGELIERAHEATAKWLAIDEGVRTDPAAVLQLHEHT